MLKILTENYITRGFWGDEAWTALIAQLPIAEMIRVTSEDFHPPGYYLLVHLWGQLFGFSELAIRSLSAVAWLGIIVGSYFLAKYIQPERWKRLLIAVLVAASPILFTYAFESRAYAVLTLLSIASSYVFWQTRSARGRAWPIAYMLLAGACVYLHYYAWFILAAHGVYALVFERKLVLKLWWVALGVILIQLPWLPILFSQVSEVNQSYWIGAMNTRTHLEFFYRVSAGDLGVPMQIWTGRLVAFCMVLSIVKRTLAKNWTPFYRFLWIWLIIPTLIPTLISFVVPIFFYRYLIFSAVPIIFLASDGLWQLPRRVAFLCFALLLGLYVHLTWLRFQQYPHTVRQELVKLHEHKQPGIEPLYTVLPSFAEVMYYAGKQEEIRVLPLGLVQASGKSLLDSYIRQGKTTLHEPSPDQSYWIIEPGPSARFVND